ncbi:hypothetical protein GCM10010483_18310 [Actinokineospora diospyrosa]
MLSIADSALQPKAATATEPRTRQRNKIAPAGPEDRKTSGSSRQESTLSTGARFSQWRATLARDTRLDRNRGRTESTAHDREHRSPVWAVLSTRSSSLSACRDLARAGSRRPAW